MKPPGRRPVPRVLLLDEHLLVVDKPAGMIVGRGNERVPGVAEALAGSGDIPADEPFLDASRSDPDLSGVLVYARDEATRAALQEQFDSGAATLTYDALVAGYVDEDGETDLRLAYHKSRGRLEASPSRGRPARTRYRLVERVLGHTWLEVIPDQVRPEQVRVHLAAIGHPLAIDPVHGGAEPLMLSSFKPRYRASARRPERPLLARLSLHARTIAFTHPARNAALSCTAELPRDFAAAVRQLARLI